MVNGSAVNFPDAQPYSSQEGRTMVPVRMISEQLGAKVGWDAVSKQVNIDYQGKKIKLPVDEKVAYVDGGPVELDAAAVMDNSKRIMVPLRFVSEALGAKVLWSGAAATVRISTGDSKATATGDRNKKYGSAPAMVIDPEKQYLAEITANRGSWQIELLAADAPLAVNNFVFLAREGFYNGIQFHRIVKNFMIQTGDPLGNGTGGPGYTFNDELPPRQPYAPGIVAMANSGPNTNGSQFFICTGEEARQLNNNPNYTVFGRVSKGMEVVLQIANTPVASNGKGEISKPMEVVYLKSVEILEK